MKKIFTVIVLAGFLIFIFAAGSVASNKTVDAEQNKTTVAGLSAQAGALSVKEARFDFGTISMKRGKVHRLFPVANESDIPVTIQTITTSCMCTEAFLIGGEARKGPFGMPGHGFNSPPVNEVIPAKESRNIEVVFDPAAHGPAGIGRIERSVFIETAEGGTQAITIKALVTP